MPSSFDVGPATILGLKISVSLSAIFIKKFEACTCQLTPKTACLSTYWLCKPPGSTNLKPAKMAAQ